jgi:A/G-specific adenine glycosylase
LASAKDEDIMEAWAGLGYYSRARNLIKCARLVVKDYNSIFPQDEKLLLELPGIGPYTASAIRAIAFNKKANVIDGNIDRVIVRLFAIMTPISFSKTKIKTHAANIIPKSRFGDYAQALMDLGSQICTPKNPKCNICPVNSQCDSYKQGKTDYIPKPLIKKPKPIKYGYVFVILTKNNTILLERRPNLGILGGMLAFPSTSWQVSNELKLSPPFQANWDILNRPVYHTFSHFHLELKIAFSVVVRPPIEYLEISLDTFNPKSLPTLMRKVFAISANKISKESLAY